MNNVTHSPVIREQDVDHRFGHGVGANLCVRPFAGAGTIEVGRKNDQCREQHTVFPPVRCLKEEILDPELRDFIETLIKNEEEPEKAGQFAVVLHNDPLNGMDYVVKVIKSVFGYGTAKAVWLMMKAHFTGKSTLWVGEEADALKKRDEMIACGPDERMVKRGATALTVTVEEVS